MRSIPENKVPLPKNSLIPPRSAKTRAKPRPIKRPSKKEGAVSFLAAKDSTRAKTIQFVTIRGMKMPKAL